MNAKRTIYTIWNVFGTIGGVIGVLSMFFEKVLGPYSNLEYELRSIKLIAKDSPNYKKISLLEKIKMYAGLFFGFQVKNKHNDQFQEIN